MFFDDISVKVQSVPTTILVQENHYYPFGLGMRGLEWTLQENKKDKFTYNKQELQTDFDLNWLSYRFPAGRDFQSRPILLWVCNPSLFCICNFAFHSRRFAAVIPYSSFTKTSLSTYTLQRASPSPQTPPPSARLLVNIYKQGTSEKLVTFSQSVSSEGQNKWEELSIGLTVNQPVDIEVICENTSTTPVFFDDISVKVQSVPTTILVQENHYYPFGLGMRGLEWTAPSQKEDRFTFQSKEKQTDFDLNISDFEARMYETYGRTWQIDPHAENYYSLSPYSFLGNNPLLFTDPTGKDGMLTYTAGQGTKEDPHVITITANYYYNQKSLSKNQISALQKATQNFNGTVTNYSGKEKDGSYTVIKYQIGSKGFDTDEEIDAAVGGDMFTNSAGGNSGYGNKIGLAEAEPDDKALGADMRGSRATGGSKLINIYQNNINKSVALGYQEPKILESMLNHEIGHNLGGEHGDPYPMGKGHIGLYESKASSSCLGDCPKVYNVSSVSVTRPFGSTILQRISSPQLDYQMLQWRKGSEQK